MSSNNVVLLLGSNINKPEKNIDNAILLIDSGVGGIVAKSSKIATNPVEFVSTNIFCNIALLIRTNFSPISLLKKIKEIEKKMGRLEDSTNKDGYEDRIIDIDIVSFGNIVYKSSKLTIPHFRHLYEREFSKALLKELNTNAYEK